MKWLLLLVTPFVIFAQDASPGAAGPNSPRIEHENRLLVPPDKRDQVWSYLEKNFVTDVNHLKSYGPLLTSSTEIEEFTDIYFDTPTLALFQQKNSVRHRRRINLTNPDDEKNNRELVQIKFSNIDSDPLNRGEIKFEVKYSQASENPDDRHQLLRLVKTKQRDELKANLTSLGIDPYATTPIVTLKDKRNRIYISQQDQPLIAISFDQVSTQKLWAKSGFIELEYELNEITYTQADAATRQAMETTLGQIVAEIQRELPYLKPDLNPKYNKVLDGLRSQIPFLPQVIFLTTQINNSSGFVGIVLAVAGILIVVNKAFPKKSTTANLS